MSYKFSQDLDKERRFFELVRLGLEVFAFNNSVTALVFAIGMRAFYVSTDYHQKNHYTKFADHINDVKTRVEARQKSLYHSNELVRNLASTTLFAVTYALFTHSFPAIATYAGLSIALKALTESITRQQQSQITEKNELIAPSSPPRTHRRNTF